jgi:hypothetical protein
MPTPSLILVPARFKTGKLYTPVATTSGGVVLGASGDFNVTRATTATRVNASGLIEVVASGIPRLDYPLGGGCPALLIEPSGTNGILNSENTATNWALGLNLSSGYVDVIGVSGNNLTVAVSGSNIGSSAGRLSRSNNNVALASGSTYTISFLIKKTGTHTIGGYYAVITGAASGNLGGGFDISGSFSSGSLFAYTGVTSRIRRIELWGTDVYRCSETFTMTGSGTLTNFHLAPLSGVTSQLNPAVGLGIAFAAPQIELGSVPTTFIPTTTASATRNAEVITLSGAVSGCIGQTQGTLYAEVDVSKLLGATARPIFAIETGTSRVQLFFTGLSANTIRALVRETNVTKYDARTTITTTGIIKLAIAYKSLDTAFYVNGVQITNVLTNLSFGSIAFSDVLLGNADANFLNDRIRSAAIYTTRLTNAELAALTT